jgi:hypothetical protein
MKKKKDKALKKPKKPVKVAAGIVKKNSSAKKAPVKAASVKAAPPAKAGLAKEKGKNSAKSAAKGKVVEPVVAVLNALAKESEAEIVLTNADGKKYCRVHDCDNEGTTEGYCRYHYLALWKRNKIKAKILQGGKLDKYIEDLTAKYPDKYLEMLRKDLASEKDFNVIVAEMDVEDAGDENEGEEEASRFIEEVRGGMPTPDDDEGSF